MAKKGRRREKIRAPESEYRDEHGSVLVLRGCADARHPRAVRRRRRRQHPLPGGRLAARGRVPVRTPGRALGDRGRRADHAPEGAARALSLRVGRGAALDSHRAARAPRRALPGHGGTVNVDALRPLADRLLPRGRRAASRSRSRPRRSAAPLLLALQREVLERGAWPLLDVTLPGQSENFWSSVADSQLDSVPSAEVAAMREIDATLRIEATDNANALASRRPGADGALGAGAGAAARGAAGEALGDHAVADAGRGAAGRDGHARARGVRRAGAVPGSRRSGRGVGRAARVPGRADRPVGAGAGDPHRGPGHRPAPRRRGPHLGQLRRQAQHAVGRGLHRPARDVRRGRDPLHDPDRATRRRRGGRDAGVPRGRRSSTPRPSAATPTCRRRWRPTRAPATWASSASAPTSASTARSARSCSTRRSAGPSIWRSAAPIRRPAAPTSPSCTGT